MALLKNIGPLDHYTLIVSDAKSTLKFYVDVCGFNLVGEILLNSGTVNSDQHDMLNFILQLPGKEEQLCVITQGLNNQTMFSQYLRKYGSGIHHLGYRVNNIEETFMLIKKHNIKTTSTDIIEDPIFGVKQFFIDRTYSGVFIEFIERTQKIDNCKFTMQNMKRLSDTMTDFI